MTHARLWLVAGLFLALTAFLARPVAAQQFPDFSKKLREYKISKTATAIVYRDTKGKHRVGLIRTGLVVDAELMGRMALATKFSPSTIFSNFTLIGDSLYFIAEDKAWSVRYFWILNRGRLHFAATNAARKKTVLSKGLRKTSIAYPVLTGPTAKSWWLAEQKGRGEDISAETISAFSFDFGGVVLNRRTVLLAYEINARDLPLGNLEDSLSFLYRLRGGRWKPKRIKLDGLPRPAPDLNGDGINEVVVVSTSYFKASTTAISELIWWDGRAGKMKKSGIKAEDHFGEAPLNEDSKVFSESTLQFQLNAQPFPLIVVKGQKKIRNEDTMEIEILGSFERSYQWNPAKRAFVQTGGKERN